MKLKDRINLKARENKETGLSTVSTQSGGRFFEKDGNPNVQMRGIPFLRRISIYQYMMKIPGWKFLALIGLTYVSVNLVFALIYFFNGVSQLGGMDQQTMEGKFWEAFFFSAQTLTTVGYGDVYPSSLTANTIAAFESLTGVLMFAIATGLMYGRFSQPKAYLIYSKVALFAPYKDGYALMLRFAPYKNHILTDVEVKLTLVMKVADETGEIKNRFYSLPLELSKANTLTANWTIVHVVNEESPFYQLKKTEIDSSEAELLVFVKGHDEEYANSVVSRSSYTTDEFIYGAKFDLMYEPNEDRSSTVLHLDKIDHYHEEPLPVNLQ